MLESGAMSADKSVILASDEGLFPQWGSDPPRFALVAMVRLPW